MNKLYTVAVALLAGMSFVSCGDSFLESEPTDKLAAGGTATLSSINSGLAATYQILLFDNYANGSYESALFIGDIQSDDIFKGGGDANDGMSGMNYAVSQFTADANHTLSGTWNIYTSGNARANSVIISCENVTPSNTLEEKVLKQYNAEGHFLRAYFTYMLWKNFGNIVFFTEPLEPPYVAPQMKADDVYKQILSDVDVACEEGALEMSTNGGSTSGRISHAAALMLRASAVMYQKDESRYTEIANDMATIIKSGKYELMDDYAAMWDNENEFCKESIFESNHMGEGKDWSSSWTGYGTNLPAYISPNELKDPSGVYCGGWGFGPVRTTTYKMFADGDSRRDGSILDWANKADASYSARFQDTGLFLRKYAARPDYKKAGANDLNYCNNTRIYRYAETLLNYAELVVMNGVAEQQGVSAQDCLNMVRDRAFGDANHRVTASAASIKNERHYEFVGEGKRYYDLVRWGDAATVLTENLPQYNSVRTWNEYNKYLPLPQGELDKTLGTEYPLVQNNGYN